MALAERIEKLVTNFRRPSSNGIHSEVELEQIDPGEEFFQNFPHLKAMFDDQRNWVETGSGKYIKRSVLKNYLVRKDGREIQRRSANFAMTFLYQKWVEYSGEKVELESSDEHPNGFPSPLLTKSQMMSFATFIANPPDIPYLPKQYTVEETGNTVLIAKVLDVLCELNPNGNNLTVVHPTTFKKGLNESSF